VRPAGGFDQAVSHQSSRRDDGIHNASIDQLSDDQPLLGHGHGAGQRHHDEGIFVQRHGFEHVGGFAQLAPGKGGLGHCPHQAVDRRNLAQVEWFEWDQPVFDGIMQITILALSACSVRLRLRGMIFRIAMIALFHDEPPSKLPFSPTRYSTGSV
jgi:hypothetical protein